MNILEKASNYLDGIRNKVLTVNISYNDEAVKATLGKTIFKIQNEFGVVYIESPDFLISVSALLDVPAKGDAITVGDDEYEVLAPDNEPVWRYTDAYKTTYRIHTKKVN